MHTVTMHYPGDPPGVIFLMFGKEFREKIRGNQPGSITISTWDGSEIPEKITIPVQEIICDQCNREIGDDDPLALLGVPSRVYCWPCHENLNGPHLVRGKKK